jgi:hypothetical protein
MFSSTYKEDTSRKTFLDLPGEIRNAIYEYAMFDPNVKYWRPKILGGRRKLRTDFSYARQYEGKLARATLSLLGAMNKLIRQEARTLF